MNVPMTRALASSEPSTRSGLSLAVLPAVRTLVVHARAVEAQRLPSLATTALHGAFSSALEPLSAEAYALLVEAGVESAAIPGVNDRAPAPLVMAPEHRIETEQPLELEDGGRVSFRITLIGGRAIALEPLVVDAIEEALRRGLGVRTSHRAHTDATARPGLELVRLDRSDWTPPMPRPQAGHETLELRTPLRLKAGGRILARLDAEGIWSTLLRRADALSRLYGGGPLFDAAPSCPFEILASDTRIVRIRRYSSRQEARMEWPGVIGTVMLAGRSLAGAWPLLSFGSAVQIGKGTTFGFGRYELETHS